MLKNLGGHGPFGPQGYAYVCLSNNFSCHIQSKTKVPTKNFSIHENLVNYALNIIAIVKTLQKSKNSTISNEQIMLYHLFFIYASTYILLQKRKSYFQENY